MTKKRGRRRIGTVAAVLAVALLVPAESLATGVEHDGLVAVTPRTDTPEFLDGEVRAGLQVGNRIIVGGTFTEVRDDTFGTLDQAYLVAYDLTTGRLDTHFLPELDGLVNSIADGGDGSIVVVGKFRNVNELSRRRVVKLRLVDGSVVRAFTANADAQVYDVAVSGNRAFFGGSFLTVNGEPRSRLAAVDLATGRLDDGFDLPVTEPTGWNGSSAVRGVDVSPDGTTLATVHNDTYVDGLERQGIALIDIAGDTASVLPWWTDNYAYDCQPWFPQFTAPLMRDVQFSADGSYLIAASAIGNFAPGCDVTVRFPTSPGGPAEEPVEPDWVARMWDTPDAIAVTDAGIYVGGHIRWLQAPGTLWTDWPNGNTNDQPPQTLLREQIGVISVADGTALDWDPGANGLRGVLALRAVAAGLLVGSDGTRIGGEQTYRHALFEAPTDPVEDETDPSAVIQAPAVAAITPSAVAVRGSAFDDHGVADVLVTVQSVATGDYLQLDGSFGPEPTDHSTVLLAYHATDVEYRWRANLEDGEYVLTARAVDVAGNTHTPTAHSFTVNTGPDGAPPEGYISAPGTATLVDSVPMTVSGLAWDDVGVDATRLIIKNTATGEYLQNDGTMGPGFNKVLAVMEDPDAPLSYWSWTGTLPDGPYRVRLHLKDLAGAKDPLLDEIALTVETVVDVEDPDGAIDVPADGAEFTSVPLTFSGTATDDVGVTEVGVIIKDRTTGDYLQGDGTMAPAWAILPATLDQPGAPATGWTWTGSPPNGEYQISVRAEDASGKIDGTKPRAGFTLTDTPDLENPDATISEPAQGEELNTLPITVSGSATDDIGVAEVGVIITSLDTGLYLQPDGTMGTTWALLPAVLDSPGAAFTTWSWSGSMPNGNYRISARAEDQAGKTDPTKAKVTVLVNA